MQRSKWFAGIALVAVLAAMPATLNVPLGVSAAQSQEARVSFSVFFGELRPHGVWVRHARYNYVWCPRVDVRWRPYTNGRWLYVRDLGWYFDSDEPFAWAVYHYGRWHEDEDLGWCWVPGRHWAPAWVSWRRSNDYIGWAPLRPEEDGYSVRLEVTIGEPAEQDDWVFVPVRSFVEPSLSVNIVFGNEQPEIFARTEYVGPVIIQNNTVINNIIDIDFIQQQTNTEVTVVEVAAAPDPDAASSDEASGTIEVFAPVLDEPVAEDVPEDAVEPEVAQEELAEPAEANADADANAAVEAATPAGDAGADGSTEATTEPPTGETEAPLEEGATGTEEVPDAVTECPEGQELVDGACVPIADEEGSATEPAVPASEPDEPSAESAEPALEGETSTDLEAPVSADSETAADPAPAAEEVAPEAEAAPEEDTMVEEIVCEQGFVLVEGVCVPIEDASDEPAAAN